MKRPEALRLAELMDAEQVRTVHIDVMHCEAAAELRRLHEVEKVHLQWLEKTEWVQDTAKPHELGQHRADVMRQRIDLLHEVNTLLIEALTPFVQFNCSQEFITIVARSSDVTKARAALAKAQGEKE